MEFRRLKAPFTYRGFCIWDAQEHLDVVLRLAGNAAKLCSYRGHSTDSLRVLKVVLGYLLRLIRLRILL